MVWKNVAACLRELLGEDGGQGGGIKDRGCHSCIEAYQFLYDKMEAAGGEEETPEDLQCFIPLRGAAVVDHIVESLRPAVASPADFAASVSPALPLLTLLLNDKRCCAQLSSNNRADEKVLSVLLGILEKVQEQLMVLEGNDTAAGHEQMQLADLANSLLTTIAYQVCDLSNLSESLLQKIMTVMRLAVNGSFGDFAPLLPAQGLQAAYKLLPRLATNPGCAGEARGLLKAILLHVLKEGSGSCGRSRSEEGEKGTTVGVNEAEVNMAVTALTQAQSTCPIPLLGRDPVPGKEPSDGSYCSFIREHFQSDVLEHLANNELPLAVRVVERLLPLMSPAGLMDKKVIKTLLDVLDKAMKTNNSSSSSSINSTAERLKLHKMGVQSLRIWTCSYVLAVARDWPLIVQNVKGKDKQRKEKFLTDFLNCLSRPLLRHFSQAPFGGQYQREHDCEALRLCSVVLSKMEWQPYLWSSSGSPSPASDSDQILECVGSKKDASMRGMLLNILATAHNDSGSDPAFLRFEAGLRFLSSLVPGAMPDSLLLKRDHMQRGWQDVPPVEIDTQRHLLVLAIRVLAHHDSIQEHYRQILEHQQRQQQQQQRQQAQQRPRQRTALPSSSSSSFSPRDSQGSSLPPPPLAEKAVIAAWSHLLQRLMPPLLLSSSPSSPPSSLETKRKGEKGIDGAIMVRPRTEGDCPIPGMLLDEVFEVLRNRKRERRGALPPSPPLALLHALADEALKKYATSDRRIQGEESRLWKEVVGRVYAPPPSSSPAGATVPTPAPPAHLGLLLLGLKALLLRPIDPRNTTIPTATSPPPPALPISQLLPFLEGLLRRLTTFDGKNVKEDVPTPNPFLYFYCAGMTRLIGELGKKGGKAGGREERKEVEMQACAVLEMLPKFATCVLAGVAFRDEEALQRAAGGRFVVQQWANLLSACLERCGGSGGEGGREEGEEDSLGYLLEDMEEEPEERLRAVLDVLGPLWVVQGDGGEEEEGGERKGGKWKDSSVAAIAGAAAAADAADAVAVATKKRLKSTCTAPALATLVCPLAHAYLRSVNTMLQVSPGGRRAGAMAQQQRQQQPQQQQQQQQQNRWRRTLLNKYAVKASMLLLQVLQEATAAPPSSSSSSSSSHVYVHNLPSYGATGLHSPSFSCSSPPNTNASWLSACLKPAPPSWDLEALGGIAEALACWWTATAALAGAKEGGGGGAGAAGAALVVEQEEQQSVHPCRAALMKDVKRITDSLFDSLSSSENSSSGSGSDTFRRSSNHSFMAGSSALLHQAPAAYLRALSPLLLAILSNEAGQQRVATWWRASGLGKKENLRLTCNGEDWGNENILSGLRALVGKGLIMSKDPTLASSSVSSSSSSTSPSTKQKNGQRIERRGEEENDQSFIIEGNGGGPSQVRKRWSGRSGSAVAKGGSNKRTKAV